MNKVQKLERLIKEYKSILSEFKIDFSPIKKFASEQQWNEFNEKYASQIEKELSICQSVTVGSKGDFECKYKGYEFTIGLREVVRPDGINALHQVMGKIDQVIGIVKDIIDGGQKDVFYSNLNYPCKQMFPSNQMARTICFMIVCDILSKNRIKLHSD